MEKCLINELTEGQLSKLHACQLGIKTSKNCLLRFNFQMRFQWHVKLSNSLYTKAFQWTAVPFNQPLPIGDCKEGK